MSDTVADARAGIDSLQLVPSTAEQLRAARQYIWRNCPPEWLADTLDALGITEGTTT